MLRCIDKIRFCPVSQSIFYVCVLLQWKQTLNTCEKIPKNVCSDAGVRQVNPKRWHQRRTSASENYFRKLCGQSQC